MDQAQRRWLRMGLIGGIAVAVILSRKPDAVLNAQFWAEDGSVWYKQAYEMGWQSLLFPQNGYFQTVSKLTASLAQWASLSGAPLFFNAIALAFKVLPILLVCSRRGCRLFPGQWGRFLLCAFYLAHPYSWEVFLNVTNIHWHLSLAVIVLLYFDSWEEPWQKLSDVTLTALCGLSGIFALFLAPIAIWRWRSLRDRRSLVLSALLTTAAIIQVSAIITTASDNRSSAPLGASLDGLFRILGGQVAAAGLLGDQWSILFAMSWWQDSIVLPLVSSGFAALVFARALSKGSPVLRGLIVFAAAVVAAALVSPQISGTQAQWPLFERPLVGGRYVFIPIIALHASLIWIAANDARTWYRRAATLALLAVALVAVPASWRISPYQDLEFQEHAIGFETAPPGTVVEIPINPPGWSLRLRKKTW